VLLLDCLGDVRNVPPKAGARFFQIISKILLYILTPAISCVIASILSGASGVALAGTQVNDLRHPQEAVRETRPYGRAVAARLVASD
jgi:hypothetical protein